MIKLISKSERESLKEGTTEYDCDYRAFQPIVEQLNEMGAPITLYDLMELIEGKLLGTLISGKQDPYLVYTLIVDNKKRDELIAAGEAWEQKQNGDKSKI